MKKATSLILALLMTVSVLFAMPVTGLADSPAAFYKHGSYQKFSYYINKNNEIVIDEHTDYDAAVIEIPTKINGKKVTELGVNALRFHDAVEELVIPEGIKTIRSGAVSQCYSLKKVTIPDSVTYIGPRAFYGCKNLATVKIGKNIKNIGFDAFLSTALYKNTDKGIYLDNCLLKAPDIKEFTINDNTTLVAGGAFEGCTSLESVHMPKSLKYISSEAFWGCKNLTSVDLNEGLKEIGDNAFYRCDNLREVIIPKTVTKIGEDAFGYYSDTYRTPVKNFTIKSYTNTAAEKYAKNNKFKFSSVFLATPAAKIKAGKKQIKVSCTEYDNATGFQVKYTKGSKSTTKTFKSSGSTYKTVKNVAKGKHKVQVRVYIESGKKRIYSSWTSAKTVTVR